MAKVKNAIYELGAKKVPRPYSFPIMYLFLFKFNQLSMMTWWGFVKNSTGDQSILKGLTRHVSLLSWKRTLLDLITTNYPSISLINSTLKIISKILVMRLSKVMGSLVDNSQSTFISSKYISHNIVTT